MLQKLKKVIYNTGITVIIGNQGGETMKRIMRLSLLLTLALMVLIIPVVTIYAATVTVHVKPASLDQQDSFTDISSWHFLINQILEADAPTSIHVTWTNGYSADVPLLKWVGPDNPDKTGTAHYVVDADLNTYGFLVKDATAEVPEGWTGQFVLSDVSHGKPPIPEMPAVALLGLGIAGIGAFIYFQRRKAAAAA